MIGRCRTDLVQLLQWREDQFLYAYSPQIESENRLKPAISTLAAPITSDLISSARRLLSTFATTASNDALMLSDDRLE
jgi:hypothetical protein